jgi:hypothetical protein
MATEAPYGTWSSPIDGDAVARAGGRRYSMLTAGEGAVYWSEARPLDLRRPLHPQSGGVTTLITPVGKLVGLAVDGEFVLAGQLSRVASRRSTASAQNAGHESDKGQSDGVLR